MEQYISKSALVAKIERIKNICQGVAKANEDNEFTHLYYCGKAAAYSEMAELINTLEVKEVDLEKEYEEFVVDDPILGNFITNDTMGMVLAKHFFGLGIKAQKGE